MEKGIDSSHSVLFAGGLVMCRRCGSLAASVTKKSLLFSADPCRGRLPEGSKYRLQTFMRGQLPYKADTWPDGQAAGARQKVWSRRRGSLTQLRYSLDVAEDTDSGDEAFVMPSEVNRVKSLFALPPYVPSSDALLSVACVLDSQLAVAAAQEKAGQYPEILRLDPVYALGLDGAELSACVEAYLEGRFQEFWAEELAGFSYEFELQLCELIKDPSTRRHSACLG